MSRFFLEVAYKGTNYSGFQVQQNAITIQSELEKALRVYFRTEIALTGSSRTDAGVHAVQNFFHFDFVTDHPKIFENSIYNLNAILPGDIVVKRFILAEDQAHSRFDARHRIYQYVVYNKKDPFLADRAYYYPYPLDLEKLNEAAGLIKDTTDFETFCKKNVQVQHYICHIHESKWVKEGETIVYLVKGNRFLRGMVRGLVGTMLKVGTGKLSLAEFSSIIISKQASKADFSMPAHGLTLIEVGY